MEGPLPAVQPRTPRLSYVQTFLQKMSQNFPCPAEVSERRALALAAHRVLIPKEAGQERWQLPS